MKRFKKLISVMLTALMTLAMAAPVFAEPADDVTHTYEVYQIFTGNFSGTEESAVLSDVKWGQNAKADQTQGSDVAENILESIEELATKNDNEKATILAKYADLNSEPYTTIKGKNDENIVVNVSEPGYYLIKDEDGSQGTSANANYALYMVKVVNNTLTFKPKVGVPTVDKEIRLSDNSLSKNSNGAIGDTVNYEFIGTMPDNFELYNTYFYKFTDTLSKGLEYNENLKVVLRNEGMEDLDVTSYFWKQHTDYDEVTGTTITVGMKDIKVLTYTDESHPDAIATITKDTKVVVTYSATIRSNAVIGNPGNPNKVDLEYSNNPNDSGTGSTPPPTTPDEPTTNKPTGKTPESKVVTYTTELKIHKTMEGTDLPTGVEFTLTGTNLNKVNVETGEQFVEVDDNTGTHYKLKDGTYTEQEPVKEDSDSLKNNKEYYESLEKKYKLAEKSELTTIEVKDQKVKATVGEDGYLTFAGLSEGTYTLEETKTPDGFNKINPITVVIKYENEKFKVEWTQTNENNEEEKGNGAAGDVIVDDQDNTFSTEILNKKGSLLPSTGGIGTTIFYIVGGILVVGAAILLVTKKRMSREA